MSDANIRRIETELTEQAARIVPNVETTPPVASLMRLHVRRQQRHRLNVAIACLVGFVAMVVATPKSWLNGINSKDVAVVQESIEPIVEGVDQNVVESDSLEKLVSDYAAMTGSDVRLVSLEDEHGKPIRVIFVPERVTPVSFQQLSPSERQVISSFVQADVSDAI